MKTGMCLAACAMVVGAGSALGQVSNFSNGNQGWVIEDISTGYPVTFPIDSDHNPAPWSATDGFPTANGALRVPDLTGETFVSAPANYLGDRTSSLGQNISFDIYIRYTDDVDYTMLAIAGRCGTLFYVMPSPPVDQWTHVTIPLAPSDRMKYNSGDAGDPATLDQIRGILQDVRGVFVRLEWHTGDDDTTFDNFIFPGTAVPARCPADFDDGTGSGHPDGGVTIDDLLYYLQIFADGSPDADVDNGAGAGSCDGGVTIDDLLFFLGHFADGC